MNVEKIKQDLMADLMNTCYSFLFSSQMSRVFSLSSGESQVWQLGYILLSYLDSRKGCCKKKKTP